MMVLYWNHATLSALTSPKVKNASCFAPIGTAARMPTMIPTRKSPHSYFRSKWWRQWCGCVIGNRPSDTERTTCSGHRYRVFDSEDYGIPEFYDGRYKQDTWCLGSQYWARTPHVQNYNARYGILLDMVGGKDATFYYEGYSARTARSEMKKIWKRHMSWDTANIL